MTFQVPSEMLPVEAETPAGILLLDNYIQQILPSDHLFWETNGVVLEQMTSRKAIEGNTVVQTLADKMREFLANSYPNDGGDRVYDPVTEMHASGWDQGAWRVKDLNVPISLINVSIADGHVSSMHLRIDGSTTDFYVSGRALSDFGETLLEKPSEDS